MYQPVPIVDRKRPRDRSYLPSIELDLELAPREPDDERTPRADRRGRERRLPARRREPEPRQPPSAFRSLAESRGARAGRRPAVVGAGRSGVGSSPAPGALSSRPSLIARSHSRIRSASAGELAGDVRR